MFMGFMENTDREKINHAVIMHEISTTVQFMMNRTVCFAIIGENYNGKDFISTKIEPFDYFPLYGSSILASSCLHLMFCDCFK